jgi:preprotein translocase subunit SecG
LSAILNSLLVLTSIFLICLVLIQRGKGGGLAGAFGGMGGSSAFGTKAGDVFTKVTIVVASIWICLAMLLVVFSNRHTDSAWGNEPPSSLSKRVAPSSGGGSRKSPSPGSTLPVSPSSSPASTSTAPVSVPAIPDDAASPTSPAPRSR